MPSGRIHGQDSIILAAQAVGLTVMQGGDLRVALSVATGSVLGLFLSPDLDQDGRTSSELILIRRIPVIGHAFFMFWYPYAVLIPHRHFLSHAPVISTAGRLLYIALFWVAVLLALVLLGVDVQTSVLTRRAVGLWPWARWILVGLALSDSMHWLRDFWP